MRRVAASLAAVICALAAVGCGDGAEPGAPEGATLMLDFTPNAVHTGIYVAQHRGYFEDAGIDLTIREPSSTSDAPKLLEAGRVDFAVMDINDFGIARQRGVDLVAIAAVVQRPLASVIAADRHDVKQPGDLSAKTIGVTGVPSDDRVLDTVLAAGSLPPDSVDRVNIGFNAVAALAAGKVDAATSFWNAEGVELRREGVPTREFRVDRFGAPRYPELLLVTTRRMLRERDSYCALYAGLERGYGVLRDDSDAALQDLLEAVPALDEDAQRAQFEALSAHQAFSIDQSPRGVRPHLLPWRVRQWARWASDPELAARTHRASANYSLRCLPTTSQ